MDPTSLLPEIYNYDFDDPEKPKRWEEEGGRKLEDYFNYGFNESTWKLHRDRVKAAYQTP